MSLHLRRRRVVLIVAIAASVLAFAGSAGAVDGTLELVSQPSGVADPDTNDAFFRGASAAGGRVFFETTQKLTADDSDAGRQDVYERAGGVTTLVSQPSGVADPDADDAVFLGASADGGRVFFGTTQKLTADDTDAGRADVYEQIGRAHV